MIRKSPSVMESQEESLDIIELKRLILGLNESEGPDSVSHTNIIAPRIHLKRTQELSNDSKNKSDQFELLPLEFAVDSDVPVSRSLSPCTYPLCDSIPSPRSSIDQSNAREANISSTPKPVGNISIPLSNKMGSADTNVGDTQPISQSVFDSLIQQHSSRLDTGHSIHTGMEDEETNQMTLREGDPGHIDLLSGFKDTVPLEEHSQPDLEQDRLSPSSPAAYQPNLFPESQRFVAKTPMTTNKQKTTLQMAATTPSLPRNPLMPNVESSGGLMALSQVFQATQAPSSPFVRALQSEPMSDRPSPNIPIQAHPLRLNVSSPARTPVLLRRGFTEPHPHYISMKDSQDKRTRLNEERMTRSAENIHSGDQYDSDFDHEPSFLESHKLRKRIDSEADAQLALMTSRGMTSPLHIIRQSSTTTSPVRSDRRKSLPTSDSSAIGADRETHVSVTKLHSEGLSEEETEQEEDYPPPPISPHCPHQSSSEEDKENYGGTTVLVPDTTARAHDRLSQALDIDQSPLVHRSTQREEIASPPSKPTRLNLRSPIRKSPKSSNTMYVRDSQTSPRQEPRQDGKEIATFQATGQSGAVHPGALIRLETQAVPSSEVDRICSSPLNRDRLPSSPPTEDNVLLPKDAHAPKGPNEDVIYEEVSAPPASLRSQEFSAPSPKKRGAKLQSRMPGNVSISANKEQTPPGSHDTVDYSAIKLRVRQEDAVMETSIPETSPNLPSVNSQLRMTSTRDLMQEDDDLPPPRHMVNPEDAHRPRINTPNNSRTAVQNSDVILSSPSGRRRFALSEIAKQGSPQVELPTYDGVMNVLTSDDREFARITRIHNFHSSPLKKEHSRNNGEGSPQPPYPLQLQSDPIPTTPHTESSALLHQEDFCSASTSQAQESPEPVLETETIVRNRRGRPKRAKNPWELQPSPSKSTPAKRLPGRPRLSYTSGPRTSNPNKVSKATLPRPVVILHKRNIPTFENRTDSPDPLQADKPSTNVSRRRSSSVQKLAEGMPSSSNRDEEPESTLPVGVRCPNQVFAFWNDRIKSAYHPATCLKDASGRGDRYIVRFEDSDPVEVPSGSVKRLELRPGDFVKVDMKNVPKIAHVITGFTHRLELGELKPNGPYGEIPITDVYGHLDVILQAKERKSFPATGPKSSRRKITVPIKNVYLDKTLWNSLQDRRFTLTTSLPQASPGMRTSVDPTLAPPSSSSRLSRILNNPPGIFANMIFAVSYVEREDAKTRVTEMIVENGGRILKKGFDELFTSPGVPTVTPMKGSGSQLCTPASVDFKLLDEEISIGFACLVADRHSRRAKYMQALALNIPCLSGRWVEDCVRENRVLPWENYLLPAGESAYLHGAIKSRNLTANPAETVRFADTIAARPRLLDGQSVLLIMGKGKVEEKRKAYVFLTYALGASRVERVFDLKSAKAAILESQQGWDWVFVDDQEEAAAKIMLQRRISGPIAKQAPQRSKKRKRSILPDPLDNSDTEILQHNVRIIDNEFVCQSLILGTIWQR